MDCGFCWGLLFGRLEKDLLWIVEFLWIVKQSFNLCSLSPCEGKSSQNFVSNGNKEICSRDVADSGGPSLSWHASSTQCPTLWRSDFIVDGGDRATCPNFHS